MNNMSNDLKQLIKEVEQLEIMKRDLYEFDYSNIYNVEHEIDSLLDKLHCINILKLAFETGTAWLDVHYTLGTKKDDLMAVIDGYAMDEDCTLKFYDADEVLSYDDDYIDESFLPVNGGEKYCDMVSHVEELTVYELLQKMNSNEA